MESVSTTTSGDEIAGNIIGTTPGKINDSPFSFSLWATRATVF